MKRKFDDFLADNVLCAKSLSDLINIAKSGIKYRTIDMKLLIAITPSLVKLNNMVGMNKLKQSIFYQIIFYLQRLHSKNQDYLHTVLYGEPGCGKTTVAAIIAEIYNALGILSNNKFIVAKKKDFVAKYTGQTAPQTLEFLQSCLGGVLFIDEVYSLSNGKNNGGDSFSKEAIDTINTFLSENKNNFCCIIAGYEEDVKRCFFGVNKGLERRFQWIHIIEPYTIEDLCDILISDIAAAQWILRLSRAELIEILKTCDKKLFTNSGGDMEKLFTYIKLWHAKRIFGLMRIHRYKIVAEDVFGAIQLFKENIHLPENNEPPPHMYI